MAEDGKKGIRRPTDPDLRVKDMDCTCENARRFYGLI